MGNTENHYKVVKLLLDNGAYINAKNKIDRLSAIEVAKKCSNNRMYNFLNDYEFKIYKQENLDFVFRFKDHIKSMLTKSRKVK